MAELTVRLNLSFGTRSLRFFMIAGMMCMVASEVASESVTLTTYYPAPSGVYSQMIVTGNTYLARDGGAVGIGTSAPGEELDVAGGNGNIRATGEIQSTMTNGGAFGQIRMVSGNYGAFFRNDGANTYLLLTAAGNQYGVWNGLRPFYVNDASGDVQINNMTVQAGGNVGIGTGAPAHTLDVAGAEGNYGYLPHYQSWAAYGTGDGGAAIYNDNNGYKTLMIVGNASAPPGITRKVSVWDQLMVNGPVIPTDSACTETMYLIDGVTNCPAGQYATMQSGVISYYTMTPLYTLGVGISQDGTAPMFCCACPASGCPL